MPKKVYLILALGLLLTVLAACGGGGGAASPTAAATSQPVAAATATTEVASPAATSGGGAGAATGNAADGEKLFAQQVIGTNPGCGTCHTVNGGKLVGPSLQGIATRAGSRVSGESAEQYIHQSMVDPNAFVVPDFPQGVMPSYAKVLNDQQFADVIAYLMTLK